MRQKKLDKSNNKQVTINLINQKYVTNHDKWSVDETFFSNKYVAFVVVNTRCIIAYALKQLLPEEIDQVIKKNTTSYKIGLTSDEILEVYVRAFREYGISEEIHSDNNPTYFSSNILKLCTENEVCLSRTGALKNSNQVSESINSCLKTNLLISIHKEDSKAYKNFRLGWPDHFKNKRVEKRAVEKTFRKLVFQSHFFKNKVNVLTHLEIAIKTFNQRTPANFETSYSRAEMERLNAKVVPIEHEVSKRKSDHGSSILKLNNASYTLADTLDKTIDGLTSLSEAQKEDYKFKAVVYQAATPLEDKLNNLFLNAPKDQKSTIETILLTYQDQYNLSKIIKEKNNQLLTKINQIEKQNNEQNEVIKTLNEYIQNSINLIKVLLNGLFSSISYTS